MKKVSILIPIYNVERFIVRCVESVLQQTYENLDIVFVDDSSPDNSVKILNQVLARYSNRKNQVRIIRHETNRGLAAARNTAVEAAIGDYILHVDSDDYIDTTIVERCVERMNSANADVVMFGFNHVFLDKTVRAHVHIPASKDEFMRLILSRRTHFYVWSGMYNADLYKKYNIHAIEGINNGEDYTVTPRLIYHAKKVVGIDLPLYYYIHYNTNSYTNSFSIYSAECHVKILKMLRQYFSERGENSMLEAIDRGEAKIKSTLLLKWALTDNPIEYLDFIRKEYHDNNNSIPFGKKINLYLINYPLLLKMYCRLAFRVRHIIK